MERLDTEDWVFDLDDIPLQDGSDHQIYAMDEPACAYLPAREAGVSGTALRHRLITAEAIAAIHAEEPRQSLLQRLLGRK